MKKIFVLLVFSLSLISIYAQNQPEEISALVQKVDSLEHELDFFKLKSDIKSLSSDLSIFINELNIKSTDIKLNIYNRNFDRRLYLAYKDNYDACVGKKDAYSESIDISKRYFVLKMLTSSFSEDELALLEQRYKTIDKAMIAVESALNLYKVALEVYYDNM